MEYFERVHMYDLATRRAVHMYPTLRFQITYVLQDQEGRPFLTRGSSPWEGVADGTVAGEPVVRRTAAGDYAVPPGFLEKTPSEIMLADATRRGKSCSDCVRGTAARADRRYAERRAP
ncbi:MAG: hypothetical protein K2X35_21500 [Bryobacteraceae bacterium]|nr:hypothetical protein [Bryobacteraceae bacterium]